MTYIPKNRSEDGGDTMKIGGVLDILRTDEGAEIRLDGVAVTATAEQLNNLGAPAAANVSLADAANRYTGENVETALAEIAGAGRTNETVKAAQDAADAAAGAAAAAQGTANAAYVQPVGGIPSTDMTAAVQASLGLADTSMQGGATVTDIRAKKITLNGVNPTPVLFQAASAATVTGTVAGNWDLTGVGDGGTLIVNPDGAGDDTATINFAQGYHTGADNPSLDISAGVDNKFCILVDADGGGVQTVTLVQANCNSGANTAAEMQTQIQALGGVYAAVTVSYVAGGGPPNDHYLITSGTYGTGSSVEVSNAVDHNCAEELKIGTDNGGADTQGTGDVVDATAATPQEIIDVINADIAGLTATIGSGADANKIILTSDTAGKDSSLVIGAGTLDATLGFTNANAYYGAQGMGCASDMADADWFGLATLNGVAQANMAGDGLSITNRSTAGFDLECETAAATHDADVVIFGVAA